MDLALLRIDAHETAKLPYQDIEFRRDEEDRYKNKHLNDYRYCHINSLRQVFPPPTHLSNFIIYNP